MDRIFGYFLKDGLNVKHIFVWCVMRPLMKCRQPICVCAFTKDWCWVGNDLMSIGVDAKNDVSHFCIVCVESVCIPDDAKSCCIF